MRIAIVENTAITHHGQIGVALHEAGARITQYRPWQDGVLPDHADALIVFGGEQSALDDTRHPYLPRLAARMRAFSDAGLPVLGVCLGAQLLARGFGAQNQIGTAPEFGWVDMGLTEAGAADPVLSAAGRQFPIFEWHSDHFSLPAGAVRLAGTAIAPNQAFRIGARTYGMQFHFEANRAVVADWSRTFPELCERMQPGWATAHPALAAGRGVAADAAGLAMARAFVALI